MSNQYGNNKSDFEGKRQSNWNDEREVQHSQEGNNRRRDTKENDSFNKGREEDSFEDGSLPRPVQGNMKVPANGEFSSFPELHPTTILRLQEMKCKNLFPIQQHCFNPIYNRQDIIARDLTGSGKTLAFSLPILEFLRKNKLLGSRKIQAIVLAPTRELAIQSANVISLLKHNPNEFSSLTVYGGVSIEDQTRQLKQGVEIFVGTTGRVLDHIERGNIDFSNIKTIVLDEADQMLKLGFKEDIEKILYNVKKQCGKDLQICLFSATVPSWVRMVAKEHMRPNCQVVDLALDLKNKTAKRVEHLAINCPFHNRMAALADVLSCYGGTGKTIVFTQTKADANSLLLSDKIKQDIEVMHGDIAQNQREVTMKRFKENKFKVLVATDVASRGLDIPNVDLVIQIEPPKEVETYIHRSGRTARAGASGVCITFYTAKTQFLIEQIESQAGIVLKKIGIPQPEDVIRSSACGILTNLENVKDEVLPMFEKAAKKLIDQEGGNALKAVSKCLAYISGHYKNALENKSLLTGTEKQLTMKMTSTSSSNRLNATSAKALLDRWWAGRMAENIRTIRSIKNNGGAVFDIYDDQFARFMDNFSHVQKTEGARLEFTVERCIDLPELDNESGGNSGAWGGNNDGGFGGGNNQGSSYRGSGGGRGGYDGGRGGSRGGGSYGGDRGGRGGNSRGGSYSGGYDNSNSNRGGGGWNDCSDQQEGNWKQQPSRGMRGGLQGFTTGVSSSESHSHYSTPSSQEQRPAQKTSSSSVFVSNLTSDTTDNMLSNIFKEAHLKVMRCKLLYDEFGLSKCAGFVAFESHDDAAQAVRTVNGSSFGQKRIVVRMATQ